MKVLVACEYSGTVRDAFIARGHDAISCDLLLNMPVYAPYRVYTGFSTPTHTQSIHAVPAPSHVPAPNDTIPSLLLITAPFPVSWNISGSNFYSQYGGRCRENYVCKKAPFPPFCIQEVPIIPTP